MAYCSVADVETYAGDLNDDALVTALIARAQAWIDRYTNRTFEAAADSTRNFQVGYHTQGRELFFDADICQITEIITNADNGSGGTVIPSTDYTPMPRNETPWFGVRLKANAADDWTYTTEPEDGITVEGRWAYSLTAPDDIKHACIRLAVFLYRQKDASTFDTTAIPDAGVIVTPQGMPRDVKVILDPYRRNV